MIVIGNKWSYWLILVTYSSSCFGLLVVLLLARPTNSDGIISMAILSVFALFIGIKLIQALTKSVHSFVDLEKRVFHFGTYKMVQSVPMDEVKIIKEAFFGQGMIVEIAGRRYDVLISRPNTFAKVERIFQLGANKES